MQRKEAVKIENNIVESTHPLQSELDLSEGDKSPVGFMELLGMHDFRPSMSDMLQLPSRKLGDPNVESLEVFNQPVTPNSSSISSASSEALNDYEHAKITADNNEEEQQKNPKKELKTKKTNEKKQREPRFAFMTKSEVDHLEDGYRWRKYGQKAVKNSSFPRSYYRCTIASCNVKKRIERSFSDPSIIMTTYEGRHTHPTPGLPRPTFTGVARESGCSASTLAMPMQRQISMHDQQYHQQPFVTGLSSALGFGSNETSSTASFVQERRFCSSPSSALLQDHGLLQDLVPSHVLKEE